MSETPSLIDQAYTLSQRHTNGAQNYTVLARKVRDYPFASEEARALAADCMLLFSQMLALDSAIFDLTMEQGRAPERRTGDADA